MFIKEGKQLKFILMLPSQLEICASVYLKYEMKYFIYPLKLYTEGADPLQWSRQCYNDSFLKLP